MLITKFGGTSVGQPERMRQVLSIVTATPQPKMVVLSALSGTTNTLVQLSEWINQGKKEEALREIQQLKAHYIDFIDRLYAQDSIKDQARAAVIPHFSLLTSLVEKPYSVAVKKEILAQGELMSTRMFHMLAQASGYQAQLLPALDFMRIDEMEEPDLLYLEEQLKPKIGKDQAQLYITQGYICRNAAGEIDNLKRGGSDYTASLIGAALQSEEVQIWTDIDGMHNNDPRVVQQTFPVRHLSFDEAAELAYFGAKILHPSSIFPAQSRNVPVRLKNTMDPDAPGTLIDQELATKSPVTAIAAKDGITAIKIKSSRMLLAFGFLRKVFEVFEKYRTPIDMITTSEVAVSLTIDDNRHLEDIVASLKPYGHVEVDQNQTIVCIVGYLISENKGLVRKIFQALEEEPLRMISYGGSRYNISLLIDTSHKESVLNALNQSGIFEPAD